MEKTVVQFQPYNYHETFLVEAFVRAHHQGIPMLDIQESFYVGNKFLGARLIHWFRTNSDELAQFSSEAYFCRACGSIWARRIIIPGWWHVSEIACARHGGGYLVSEQELATLEDFPEAVIIYEFVLASNNLGD